jgi:hypothetical protein
METVRDSYDRIKLRSDKWELYFDVYEKYFSKFKNNSPTFVEVGVQGGGSLEAWVDYFGKSSKIYGVDINPLIDKVDGAEIVIGDQNDPLFWYNFLEKVGEIDCFLDDGSHYVEHQITTFNYVWPKIKPGGIFMCEDTCTSYWPGYGGRLNSPNTFIEYSKKLIDYIHAEHIQNFLYDPYLLDLTKDLGEIHFYNSQVVFVKNKPKFQRIIFNDN